MDELEQFDRIIQGFRKIIDKIERLDAQKESTKESLNLQKEFYEHLITAISVQKLLLVKLTPEVVKERFGEDKIQRDLKIYADALKEAEIGINTWEGIINKDSKTHH